MSKTDTHFLMNYLSNIIPTSYLILIYPNNYNNDSLMIRQEFIKKCIASNNCTVVDCNSLDYKELKHFIKSEFDLRNKVATNEILSIFSTWLGKDLSHIVNEIEKITLLIDDSHNNNVITKNDCSLIVKKNHYKQIYSLYLSIVNKNITLALRTIWQLLNNHSQDPLIILYVIHSTILKILNAKYMLEKKDLSNTEIAKTIKIKQEDLEMFFTQLHKHKFETLQTSFKLLLEADIQLKTTHNTQQEIQFIFEDLLILICKV
jgi:DNA polymerase III delta subunit